MGLLRRSPLHGLAGGRIVLLTVTGRPSGRSFMVPVSYVRHGGVFFCFTSGRWGVW
jgi:hypothetical protein